MNLLVAGTSQVLDDAPWLARLGLSRRDVGTAMEDSEVAEVRDRLDLDTLLAYRLEVGRRTHTIAGSLEWHGLSARVDPDRIRTLLASGALAQGASRLAEVWSRWTTLRFLMMPVTRHPFSYLNEARRLGEQMKRSAPNER